MLLKEKDVTVLFVCVGCLLHCWPSLKAVRDYDGKALCYLTVHKKAFDPQRHTNLTAMWVDQPVA